MSAKRPTGVTILAVLALISGVLGLLGIAALLSVGDVASLLVAVITTALSFAFAVGAWSLKSWAWILGIITYVLSLVLSVITVVSGGSFISQGISIVIAIIVLIYLFSPGIRAAFGRS